VKFRKAGKNSTGQKSKANSSTERKAQREPNIVKKNSRSRYMEKEKAVWGVAGMRYLGNKIWQGTTAGKCENMILQARCLGK